MKIINFYAIFFSCYSLIYPFLWISAEKGISLPLDILETIYYQSPAFKTLCDYIENNNNLSQIFGTDPTDIHDKKVS